MICSPELLHTEGEKINEILVGNGYPSELIKREINKFSAVLKLPYLGIVSKLFEKKVQELTQSTYNQVKHLKTFRHLKTRVNEHIPKCVLNLIKE